MDQTEPMEVDCKNYFMKIEKNNICTLCKYKRIGWYLVLYCICDYVFYVCSNCINEAALSRNVHCEYHDVKLYGLKKEFVKLKKLKGISK